MKAVEQYFPVVSLVYLNLFVPMNVNIHSFAVVQFKLGTLSRGETGYPEGKISCNSSVES